MEAPDPLLKTESLKTDFVKRNRYQWILLITSLLVMVLLVLYAITVGAAKMSVGQAYRAVIGKLFPWLGSGALDATELNIIWLLRMPRIVMALVAGIGLAVSGVVMQGITRNPLVSPFTIGLSNAAAFGASLAIMFGAKYQNNGYYAIVIGAFLFSIGCAILVYGISALRGMSPETLILTGIALTYLFGACTATLQMIANEQQLAAVVQWTFGSLNNASWDKVGVVSVILALAFPVFMCHAWNLNAMASGGDEVAKGLGIKILRVRLITGIMTVLITAGVISFTGVIGFVGLVGPHIARMLVGGDHRFLIPFAAICGALLLLAADTLGRTLFSPVVIPVGIVVSFLGVPLFINLILSRKKEYFG